MVFETVSLVLLLNRKQWAETWFNGRLTAAFTFIPTTHRQRSTV